VVRESVRWWGAKRYAAGVGELIGYARCSTVAQDLTAQREILTGLGVVGERIYLDEGLTGTNRARPGLDQALAAVRAGDTLVVPKLDRLARSVPDARDIGDTLVAHGVRLSLGWSIYDPADPMSKMFFNMLAVFDESSASSSSRAPTRAWPPPAPAASAWAGPRR
jgi:DNA invertase Pin-like site-specific DNA recombinase